MTEEKPLSLQPVQERKSVFDEAFGSTRGSGHMCGDIVSAGAQLWDCEFGVAYRDSSGSAFGYDGKKIDLIEAAKNAR